MLAILFILELNAIVYIVSVFYLVLCLSGIASEAPGPLLADSLALAVPVRLRLFLSAAPC